MQPTLEAQELPLTRPCTRRAHVTHGRLSSVGEHPDTGPRCPRPSTVLCPAHPRVHSRPEPACPGRHPCPACSLHTQAQGGRDAVSLWGLGSGVGRRAPGGRVSGWTPQSPALRPPKLARGACSVVSSPSLCQPCTEPGGARGPR